MNSEILYQLSRQQQNKALSIKSVDWHSVWLLGDNPALKNDFMANPEKTIQIR